MQKQDLSPQISSIACPVNSCNFRYIWEDELTNHLKTKVSMDQNNVPISQKDIRFFSLPFTEQDHTIFASIGIKEKSLPEAAIKIPLKNKAKGNKREGTTHCVYRLKS